VKSQTQQQKSQEQESEYLVANEEIGEELLLRCWNKAVEQVNAAIKINKESGVRYPDLYVSYYDEMGPMDVLQKKRWLASTTNPKTGQWNTLTGLQAAGVVSDAELKFFQGQLPRRELNSMYRHQTPDKREFLIRFERWYGLTVAGGVVTVSANNIDITKKVHFEPDFVPIDPQQSGGATAPE
jgi:hypothetical protein